MNGGGSEKEKPRKEFIAVREKVYDLSISASRPSFRPYREKREGSHPFGANSQISP